MMRTSSRNYIFGAAVCVFVFVSFLLYSSIDSRNQEKKAAYESSKMELQRLETRLKSLESEIKTNNQIMSSMRQKLHEEREKLKKLEEEKAAVKGKGAALDRGVLQLPKKPDQIVKEEQNAEKAQEMAKEEEQARQGVLQEPDHNMEERRGGKVAVVKEFLDRITVPASQIEGAVCSARLNISRADGDVQMLDVYEILPFDDPDGGVWKQGWEITYDPVEVQHQKKLEVIVVPHSHTDPGWLKTFDDYYKDQAQQIFNLMLGYLLAVDDMRFIYAEMSFFERWWAEINEQRRESVKKLLKNGHLEIVTGAWVMTDEANAHYFSTITEMIEGHEWLRNHIGEDFRPVNHWSIDPFGLSPTVAFLMARANLTNAIVQRVHYSVKKHLAKNKQLEFKWRQLFSGKSPSTDLITHVMPFFSYDIPHTCGPDPKICCQFDFRRTPPGGISCPWNVPPEAVTDSNLPERAALLYDQYRKKAQLFKTNVLFVPLGDDFRYEIAYDWEEQHSNYAQLFKYMNAKDEWNVHARFGTMADYFKLMHERLEEDKSLEEEQLPVLSGDFFTYADRNDHYWSGYFTSRPFYKHMDRALQHYLRSAEILFSLAKWKDLGSFKTGELFNLLVEARRHLSLFQHHDGVTGTAKDHVVIDYGNKMLTAIKNCEQIICATSDMLLHEKSPNEALSSKSFLSMDEIRPTHDALPVKLAADGGSEVILFNSLTQERREVACIHVKSENTQIRLASAPETPVMQQVGPVINVERMTPVINKEKYELCFMATVPALGFTKYQLFTSEAAQSRVTIKSPTPLEKSIFETQRLSGSEFRLENEFLSAKFDAKTGFLSSVTPKDNTEVKVDVSFVRYGARGKNPGKFSGGDDLSGAYLFLPDGPAKDLEANNVYVVIEGPVLKKVVVIGERKVMLDHSVLVFAGAPYVQLQNLVDVNGLKNFELAMRLKTSVQSGDEMFTDLNGFQMIRRKRFSKLPLQAHFYPMPGSAFIQDESNRVSLLGAQALGVASLEPGWIEVMLDRRLVQDDGRGLAQGVTDNKRTMSTFRLMVEPLEKDAKKVEKVTIGYHSLPAHYASLGLHYPFMILLANEDKERLPSFTGLRSAFPCDVHLVTLRTMAAPTIYGLQSARSHSARDSQALILHRLGIDCRSKVNLLVGCSTTSGKVPVSSLFASKPRKVVETSLTLLYENSDHVDEIKIEPMDIRTVRIDLS